MTNQDIKRTVYQAADSLADEGVSPSIDKVAKATGLSKTKVAPHLKQWKSNREAKLLERYENGLSTTSETLPETSASSSPTTTSYEYKPDGESSPEQREIERILAQAQGEGEMKAATRIQLAEAFELKALATEKFANQNHLDEIAAIREKKENFLSARMEKIARLPIQYPASKT